MYVFGKLFIRFHALFLGYHLAVHTPDVTPERFEYITKSVKVCKKCCKVMRLLFFNAKYFFRGTLASTAFAFAHVTTCSSE